MSDADRGFDVEEWRTAVERHRERKDEFFAEGDRSPLAPAEREGFEGLSYYPPDPDYRFELPLDPVDDREELTVGTTADGERTYLRRGRFRFELDGEAHALTAYRESPDADRLWVPFKDETNGETTYGGGRYLDLEADHRTDEGWIVDFNLAYNPFCLYSERYECPLVPPENHLDVRVEAGERADY